jgi:hypothetical protein
MLQLQLQTCSCLWTGVRQHIDGCQDRWLQLSPHCRAWQDQLQQMQKHDEPAFRQPGSSQLGLALLQASQTATAVAAAAPELHNCYSM